MGIRTITLLLATSACLCIVAGTALAQGAPAQPGDVILVPKTRSDRSGIEQFRGTAGTVGTEGTVRIEVARPPSSVAGSMRDTSRRLRVPLPAPGNPRSALDTDIRVAPADSGSAAASPLVTALPLSAVQQTTDAVRSAIGQSGGSSVLTDLRATAGDAAPPALILPRGDMAPTAGSGPDLVAGTGTASMQQLQPEEALAVGITEAGEKGVRLRVDELKRLPSRESMTALERGNAAAAPIAQAYGDVVTTLSQVISEPSRPTNVEAFQRAGASYRAAYSRSWRALATPEERRQAARTFTALSQQSQLKAIYGVVTNFPPLSYRQIYHYAQRVVGIEINGDRICSGIAIDAEWIMTAGHCLARGPLSDAVSISFDGRGSQPLRVRGLKDRWPSSIPGVNLEDPLDYVFLRIEPTTELQAVIAALDAEAGTQGLHPLCLLTGDLPYRQPVFAIGHPLGRDMTVHDYAYVWFPHRLSQQGFDQVEAETFAQADSLGRQIGDPDYAERTREALRKTYRRQERDGEISYTYMLALNELPDGAARPAFGIDTDTFSGDSGAPVFDRKTQCIAGVFGGGEDDRLVATQVSWREHEFATPIAAILAHAGMQPVDQTAEGQPAEARVVEKRRALLALLSRLSDSTPR